MYLKQHRKANLQVEGRKLIGNFELSLTNQGDREVMMEFISEMRKQLREFDTAREKVLKKKAKKAARKKKAPTKKKRVRRTG
ncbi:MAG TPA: hypothetical protein VMW50_00995 [Dehalococcoidia bacterium]|nr:hypothetical protein [Dehalococcoidia bacterium]